MFVIPKKDFTIVDPMRMDVLPPEGRDVGTDKPYYWQRRISDGDVTLVPEDQVDAAKKTLEAADDKRREAAAAAAKEAKEKADAAAAEKAKTAAPAPAAAAKPAPAPAAAPAAAQKPQQ